MHLFLTHEKWKGVGVLLSKVTDLDHISHTCLCYLQYREGDVTNQCLAFRNLPPRSVTSLLQFTGPNKSTAMPSFKGTEMCKPTVCPQNRKKDGCEQF